MIKPRNVADRVSTAAHEAAHIITRWANGRSITAVTVEPQIMNGRQINGRVTHGGMNDGDEDYFSRCVEVVAGAVGEQLSKEQVEVCAAETSAKPTSMPAHCVSAMLQLNAS
jgi:hypothetical protein